MDRREFFSGLIAGGATVRKTRKHVEHRGNIRLYHGPMTIPAHVAEAVREDPSPMRATGRGTHLVSRYADADGTVWLFRCQIPAHRGMVGEIVQVPIGQRKRIHCWSAASPAAYREPSEIIIGRSARTLAGLEGRSLATEQDFTADKIVQDETPAEEDMMEYAKL